MKTVDPTVKSNIILQLHELGAVQLGSFVMASGLKSPIYIDLRRVMARPSLLKLVAQVYAGLLAPLTFDHIAAVPYGAMAIGTAVSLEIGRPLIFPRKEVKTHGTGRQVEGLFSTGDKAVVVEDLVTKGGSALKAIQLLEAAQLTITDIVVLIDREQGGAANIAKAGYQLHAAFSMGEVMRVLVDEGKVADDEATAVLAYLAEA